MSSNFQKKTSNILFAGLIGLIIISFMFTAYQSMRGTPDTIAKVGNYSIKAREFRLAYDRQIQQYQQMFGGKGLTSKQIETFNIKGSCRDG